MSQLLLLYLFSRTFPFLNHLKSHHYDPKQQKFKIQTNNVPWLVPILTALFIMNHIFNLPPYHYPFCTLDSVPKILVKWRKWNDNILYPCKHFPPYHSVVIPIYTKTNGSISMFRFAVLISSPTNSICGSMSKCCILDVFFYGVGIPSTFSCSWIPFSFFLPKSFF